MKAENVPQSDHDKLQADHDKGQADHDKAHAALAKSAVHASFWSISAFGVSALIRLGGFATVARMLEPKSVAYMAQVMVFYTAMELLSDVGLGPSIIRSRNAKLADFANTVWTVQVIRGIILTIAALALSYPYASFMSQYDFTTLFSMLLAGSATTIAKAFDSTKRHSLNRDLNMRILVITRLAAQAAGVFAMIVAAYYLRNSWALVVGFLVSTILLVCFNNFVLPGPVNRFAFKREYFDEIFKFALWIFVGSIFTFFANSCDRVALGKLVTPALLGVYVAGQEMALAHTRALGGLCDSVLFPLCARLLERRESLLDSCQAIRLPILIPGALCSMLLLACGPAFVQILFKPAWQDASWIVQIIAVGTWFTVLDMTNYALLVSQGKSHAVAFSWACKLGAVLLFLNVGYHFWDFRGAVVGVACAELIKYLSSTMLLSGLRTKIVQQDLRYTLLAGVGGLLGWQISDWAMPRMHPVLVVVVAALAVTLYWSPALLRLWKAFRLMSRDRGPAPGVAPV